MDGYDIAREGAPLIAADWFEEHGRDEEAKSLRTGTLLPERNDGYGSGDGYGNGYGSGYGYGDGYGETLKASTLLLGMEKLTVNELNSGELYMFATGEGWMWVGRFVRPCGLFGAVFSNVVNICRTGGTAWPNLASGTGRSAATFQEWTTGEMPFTTVRFALKWSGELPASNGSR